MRARRGSPSTSSDPDLDRGGRRLGERLELAGRPCHRDHPCARFAERERACASEPAPGSCHQCNPVFDPLRPCGQGALLRRISPALSLISAKRGGARRATHLRPAVAVERPGRVPGPVAKPAVAVTRSRRAS